MKPEVFRLTNPVAEPHVCPGCGKVVKDMKRHAGSAVCSTAARRALIGRLGLVEVWFRERDMLVTAGVVVTVIRDQRGGRTTKTGKRDTRRWYAPPEPVQTIRALTACGLPDKRITKLLAGPREDVDRELAFAALRGPKDPDDAMGFQTFARPIMRPVRQSLSP